MGKSKIVNAVVRAAMILQTIAGGNTRIGKIAEVLDLSKGTTHRLLETLGSVGFVVQDPLTLGYHLGPALHSLASSSGLNHEVLFSCALQPMTELRNLTRETVLLDVRAGTQKVCIEKVDSPESIKYTNEKGFAAPIYVGGGGKVLLSQLQDNQIELLLKQMVFTPITQNTIIDQERLWAEIEETRQKGYATSFGERVLGSSCVSVPVSNYVTPVALSILGPATRFTKEKIMEHLDALKQAASNISEALKQLSGNTHSHE
jgi:DNA-binding IclR family transcriptional regulator